MFQPRTWLAPVFVMVYSLYMFIQDLVSFRLLVVHSGCCNVMRFVLAGRCRWPVGRDESSAWTACRHDKLVEQIELELEDFSRHFLDITPTMVLGFEMIWADIRPTSQFHTISPCQRPLSPLFVAHRPGSVFLQTFGCSVEFVCACNLKGKICGTCWWGCTPDWWTDEDRCIERREHIPPEEW